MTDAQPVTTFVVTDIEADGPSPLGSSMLSFASVACDGAGTVLDEFEAATGEAPSFFHLNDSEGEMGSNKDRHTLIGDGHIGVEAFRELVHDSRSQNIPLILETPQQNYEIGEDDVTPDPYDVRMMELLNSFVR